jgi:Tfp pilus assembly protein PilF
MPKNLGNLCRLVSYTRVLGLTTSLTLGAFSCQTSGDGKINAESHQKEVLESQKALVRNALDTGKPESALKSLRDLLDVYPEDASLQNLMGLTQLSLTNYARSIRHFQISYKLAPQIATGLNLSSALIESKQYLRAQKLLTVLLKQAPKAKYRFKERILHNLGYCAMQQGDTKKAEEWYRLALEENPTFFPSHLELGRYYESRGRSELAIQSYKYAADYCRTCFEPIEPLTRIYTATGRRGEAKRLLTQYLRVEDLLDTDRRHATDLLTRLSETSAPGTTAGRRIDSNTIPIQSTKQ